MQTYTFNSQQIRIQNQDGEIWFCGADVARAIG
ncbi:MAG: phage antirepressor, partial [Microcoleus sp. SU_5_3]|nr:phage antirepressor [Microcoleus sp. SU_5_3]